MLNHIFIIFSIISVIYISQTIAIISFRSKTNHRTLGFKYDAPSTFSPNTCDSTYSKYLMYVTSETDTAFFDISDCNSDGLCKLQIKNNPYKDLCVIQNGDYLVSGSCDYAWYFKIDGDKIKFKSNKAIRVGESYNSGRDCDNPYYTIVSEYKWDDINVENISNEKKFIYQEN